MEIKTDKEITFGKYKGYVPNECIDFPQYEFKKIFNYLIWANKMDDIKVENQLLELFYEIQQKYNWKTEKVIASSIDSSSDMEPRLWGNDCFKGEMSSWF